MNFTVNWIASAEQELAAVWLAAGDRNAVTRAAHRVEQRLRTDPAHEGESRSKDRRITFEGPLALVFRVNIRARKVRVMRVWGYGRSA